VIGGFGSGDLLALRAESGSIAWSDSLTAAGGNGFLANISAITGMPVVGGEQVYVIGQGNLMLSIDVHTGRRLWRRDVSGSQTPWLAGEWLFILTLDQRAAAVSTRDGEAAWITELPHYKNTKNKKKPPSNPFAWFGPILVSDRLIFAGAGRPGGPGGAALALSPYTGEILGQQNFHAAAAVAPVAAGGVVYFVTDDGALLAFR
jgi:outer membrane protein assembly factor BamB